MKNIYYRIASVFLTALVWLIKALRVGKLICWVKIHSTYRDAHPIAKHMIMSEASISNHVDLLYYELDEYHQLLFDGLKRYASTPAFRDAIRNSRENNTFIRRSDTSKTIDLGFFYQRRTTARLNGGHGIALYFPDYVSGPYPKAPNGEMGKRSAYFSTITKDGEPITQSEVSETIQFIANVLGRVWNDIYSTDEYEYSAFGVESIAHQWGYDDTLKLLTDRANAGEVGLQLQLAHSYETGIDAPQDFTEAFRWYQMAAEHGSESAQLQIGRFLQDGLGMATNSEEAMKHFVAALESGVDTGDIVNLGVDYENGNDVRKSPTLGFALNMMAAKEGNEFGCFNVGEYYETGMGTGIDKEQALIWYTKAADLGDEDAAAKVLELSATTNDRLIVAA
jgi:hypothetical protein